MSQPLITGTGITVRFKNTTVLDSVAFEFFEREIVGLVGPNGSGKSTLLKLCTALLKPTQGELTLRSGKNLNKLKSSKRARMISYVPQVLEAHSFSTYETVMMGRYNRLWRFASAGEDDHSAVLNAMERVEITHLAERKFDVLSGGEKRRTVFARALAQDTAIMALDEPTADLDLKHRAKLMKLIRGEAERGRTIIIALHDLEAALRYCDRVYMLHDGGFYKVGTPSEVITPANVRFVFDAEITIAPHPDDGLPQVSLRY